MGEQYTPTVTQAERSYVARQIALDHGLGKETHPVVYAADFRRMIANVRAESRAEELTEAADVIRGNNAVLADDYYPMCDNCAITAADYLIDRADQLQEQR